MAKVREMINGIIRNAKWNYPNHEGLHGVWDEEGFQMVTDGHRVACVYHPILNVEYVKSELHDKALDVFKNAEINCTEEIQLPPVKEIKEKVNELIGRKYKSKKVLYTLAENKNYATVNAKYLIELMEGLAATKIKYDQHKPKTGALLLESEIGKAVLLPVYRNDNEVGYRVIDES